MSQFFSDGCLICIQPMVMVPVVYLDSLFGTDIFRVNTFIIVSALSTSTQLVTAVQAFPTSSSIHDRPMISSSYCVDVLLTSVTFLMSVFLVIRSCSFKAMMYVAKDCMIKVNDCSSCYKHAVVCTLTTIFVFLLNTVCAAI